MNELIDTERVYANELKLIIDGYVAKFNDPSYFNQIPTIVLANKDILFGNIRDIYQFHNKIFLRELELIQNSISDIARLFIKCVSER